MIIVIACAVAIAVIAFILGVRRQDLPEPVPVSPFAHLDERKAAIYENLRDLQFEYRLGKLSDQDYQSTKKDLQRELAVVLGEVDKLREALSAGGEGQPRPVRGAVERPNKAAPQKPITGFICPSCGAKFKENLKFCGECGKAMKAARA